MDSIGASSSSPPPPIRTKSMQSNVLLIGVLDRFAQRILHESMRLGRSTFVLPSDPDDPDQKAIIDSFTYINSFTILSGSIDDQEWFVQEINKVHVVIWNVEVDSMMTEQSKIIAALKQARHEVRFVPLLTPFDVDRMHTLQPEDMIIERCREIRRIIEQSGIPYTYTVFNFIAELYLGRSNSEESPLSLPLKIPLYGDGTKHVSFCIEKDAARYIINAADDGRTLRKTLYIRNPENVISMNDLVSLWERKINRLCAKNYISEQELLKMYHEAPPDEKTFYASMHSAFIMGDHTNFPVDPSSGMEASQLYPDQNYTTLDEYLNRFLPN